MFWEKEGMFYLHSFFLLLLFSCGVSLILAFCFCLLYSLLSFVIPFSLSICPFPARLLFTHSTCFYFFRLFALIGNGKEIKKAKGKNRNHNTLLEL